MQFSPSRVEKRIKILLVDDQLTQIAFEKVILGSRDYDFVTARNGLEAIEIAASEQPQLILLDVMMPEMDGIEAARRIRQNAATSSIPIIMVTTRSELDYFERAFSSGCSDYLTKPLNRGELLTKIRALTSAQAAA